MRSAAGSCRSSGCSAARKPSQRRQPKRMVLRVPADEVGAGAAVFVEDVAAGEGRLEERVILRRPIRLRQVLQVPQAVISASPSWRRRCFRSSPPRAAR